LLDAFIPDCIVGKSLGIFIVVEKTIDKKRKATSNIFI
jgi:hypothetical protein